MVMAAQIATCLCLALPPVHSAFQCHLKQVEDGWSYERARGAGTVSQVHVYGVTTPVFAPQVVLYTDVRHHQRPVNDVCPQGETFLNTECIHTATVVHDLCLHACRIQQGQYDELYSERTEK